MDLAREITSLTADLAALPMGPPALLFAFTTAAFALLWLRLRRQLRRIGESPTASSSRSEQAPILQPRPADMAPLLASMSEDLDETRRRLALVIAERDSERKAAQQADHSKTRFLAAASHDLRQPLQALGLFVATLAQRQLPDDIKNIVGKIEGSLEALEHLLDGLLDISRLDAGAVETHSVTFPLQSLFDRMFLEFEPLAERKGLRFRVIRTSAMVRSDPALLERILRNLLSNAIRYTQTGGVVTGCLHRNKTLRIEIWDSGLGIAPEDQKEIFREFRQLSPGVGSERQGLGLGLAIVERLSQLLGLQIEVRSSLGRGSMFAIVLPASAHLGDRTKATSPAIHVE